MLTLCSEYLHWIHALVIEALRRMPAQCKFLKIMLTPVSKGPLPHSMHMLYINIAMPHDLQFLL